MSDDQTEYLQESSTFEPAAQNGHSSPSNGQRKSVADDEVIAPAGAMSALPESESNQREGQVAVDRDLVQFAVQMDSNSRNTQWFLAGELVRGCVVITLAEALQVHNLDLHLIGGATVGWQDVGVVGQTGGKERQQVEYYVNETQNVLGVLPGELLLVSKGTHKFHFQFRLPAQAPNSFTGTYGNIRCVIKAVVKTVNGTNSHVSELAVRKALDSLAFLKFLAPAEIRFKKNYTGRGLRAAISGPVQAMFSLDRMAFAFGDFIEINGQVENRSYASVSSIEVSLQQQCIYTAQGFKVTETKKVAHVTDTFEVKHSAVRRWREVRLAVPENCAPSYLEGCNLLEVYYELTFTVNMGSSKPLVAKLPVVIGLAAMSDTVKQRLSSLKTADGNGPVPLSLANDTLNTQVYDYGTVNSSFALRSSVSQLAPDSMPSNYYNSARFSAPASVSAAAQPREASTPADSAFAEDFRTAKVSEVQRRTHRKHRKHTDSRPFDESLE